jgi:restriction endonuclease S subunit
VSKYDTKVWASDCFSVNSNNSLQINNLYLYYYLKFSQDKIYKLQHGNGQPHVNTNDMIKFKIKLPSPNIQQYIVNRIEQIESFQKQNMAYLQMLEQEIDTMNLMIDNNNNNNNITEFSPNASPNIDLIENDELILEL